ncbi:protein of unknown function [Cruoricaptor ignavus]|uniref:DUF349 domain-containing protein n=1 Tax=Cruoricaptor ignavus TaxID=1118202 RepID=A0A1M6DAT9_9FLAO|nr:DUF349 domain-containing protein [Cruoricaptor ignavus]SHI70333.1 protein of unknown function [Cruoricaptor ignavus]
MSPEDTSENEALNPTSAGNNQNQQEILEQFSSEESTNEENSSENQNLETNLAADIAEAPGSSANETADDASSAKTDTAELDPEQNAKNIAEREGIVERLKNLYMNTQPGTNLFKEIREIRNHWETAGHVAKADFKNISNNYFYHLGQFYKMLDLNKEYRDQEYAQNLERRRSIIERAKELLEESSVQKALNELQYLHKVWKEEAGPVAEEFREETWQEFKEISNQIHARKSELSEEIEAVQNANLERKNALIQQIKEILASTEEKNHKFWQQSIKKVEQLREEFLQVGSVPRKLSNQNWTDFKDSLRDFNSAKNEFYKNLKGDQQANLEKKRELLKAAQDNMNSEDWDTAVPLFKKLQEEWKNTGFVPRAQAEKIWEEFREASNTFFDNFRKKGSSQTASGDNWKENLKRKEALLEELKSLGEEEQGRAREIRTEWDAIGKVPRDRMSINQEFNRIIREKLPSADGERKFTGRRNDSRRDTGMDDGMRKLRNQISELENEISNLERNLNFFSNPSRENPLLADTYRSIDEKREQLNILKNELRSAQTEN